MVSLPHITAVFASLSVILLTACGFDSPFWDYDRYKVHGTFNMDGTCTAFIDDSVISNGTTDSTDYWREFAINVGGMGPGDDYQTLKCGSATSLGFRGRKGQVLQAGVYPIELLSGHISPGHAQGYANSKHIDAGWWPFAGYSIALHSLAGTVILTHVDSVRVVGSFEFTARRVSGM